MRYSFNCWWRVGALTFTFEGLSVVDADFTFTYRSHFHICILCRSKFGCAREGCSVLHVVIAPVIREYFEIVLCLTLMLMSFYLLARMLVSLADNDGGRAVFLHSLCGVL